jgi:hypothetical protein
MGMAMGWRWLLVIHMDTLLTHLFRTLAIHTTARIVIQAIILNIRIITVAMATWVGPAATTLIVVIMVTVVATVIEAVMATEVAMPGARVASADILRGVAAALAREQEEALAEEAAVDAAAADGVKLAHSFGTMPSAFIFL